MTDPDVEDLHDLEALAVDLAALGWLVSFPVPSDGVPVGRRLRVRRTCADTGRYLLELARHQQVHVWREQEPAAVPLGTVVAAEVHDLLRHQPHLELDPSRVPAERSTDPAVVRRPLGRAGGPLTPAPAAPAPTCPASGQQASAVRPALLELAPPQAATVPGLDGVELIHRAWAEMQRRYKLVESGAAAEDDFAPLFVVLDDDRELPLVLRSVAAR